MPFVGTEGEMMIKIIGASVVYGFAIYGIVIWLKRNRRMKTDDEQDRKV